MLKKYPKHHQTSKIYVKLVSRKEQKAKIVHVIWIFFILDWYSLHALPSIFQLRWWPYMVKVLSFKLRLPTIALFPENDKIQTCQHPSVHMQTSSPWWLSQRHCPCSYHGLYWHKGLCRLSASLFLAMGVCWGPVHCNHPRRIVPNLCRYQRLRPGELMPLHTGSFHRSHG